LRRFTRLPRRILAVSAATFIGAVGAVALGAAPASAHEVTLTGNAVCGPTAGTAVVTWTATNTKTDLTGTIKRATRVIAGLENDTTVAPQSSAKGSETVQISAGSVSFGLRMTWGDGFREDAEPATVDLSKLDCGPKVPPKEPTVTVDSNCDGMKITIKNTSDATRKFAVNGSNGFKERNKDLEVGDTWVVDVPRDQATKVAVKWKLPDAGEWETKGDDRYEWVKPDTCFTATPKSTCDKLEITVENTGAKAIKAVVTVGDKSEEETIEPGESSTAQIDGVDGLVAKLTVNGGTPTEFKWEKPADCGGAGGGLPQTGANTGLLAGAALVLVSGGGGLFYLARRRRIRFAA
jgi:LPXTG-motif cell wall-anchored protein